MKKFRSLILKLFLSLYHFFGYKSDDGKIVDTKDLEKFCLTFESYYRKNVKQNIIREKYLKHFELYGHENLTFKCSLSNDRGASIEFIPFDKSKFDLTTTDLLIEDFVFKDINLKVGEIPPQKMEHVAIINKRGLKNAMFKVDGRMMWLGNEIISNDGKFIELATDESNLIFKNILVDKVFFPNYLLLKGSNKTSYWKKEDAKKLAYEIFDFELKNAYFTSEEFRKFYAAPKLHELARNIEEKRQKGIYGKLPHGTLDLEADLKELREIAVKHDFSVEFTEIVMQAQRDYVNKKSWFEKSPLWTGIIGGLIVSVIIFLYSQRQEILYF